MDALASASGCNLVTLSPELPTRRGCSGKQGQQETSGWQRTTTDTDIKDYCCCGHHLTNYSAQHQPSHRPSVQLIYFTASDYYVRVPTLHLVPISEQGPCSITFLAWASFVTDHTPEFVMYGNTYC